MAGELIPEEYSKRTETIGDYPVTITFYRLGSTYNAKAEVPVNVVPYVKPDILTPLGGFVLVFPFTALVLSIVGTWLLGAEYQRLRMVYQKYYKLLREECEIPRMPLGTWWERRVAQRIGSAVSIMFGVGFSAFSFASGVVLLLYPMHLLQQPN